MLLEERVWVSTPRWRELLTNTNNHSNTLLSTRAPEVALRDTPYYMYFGFEW